MVASTPQVRGKICNDPNKPLYPPIDVGSSLWFSWLREPDTRSFHFESEAGKFTARKEERPTSTNEYWYAYRKIQGKLRKVYLGAMDELSLDRLNEVAAEISQSGQDYYYSRKSYIGKEQNSMTASSGSTLTLEANGYPIREVLTCVTDSSELEALKVEVEQLRSQLAVVTTELDQERSQKDSWMDSALQWQSIAEQVQEECQELRKEQAAVTSILESNGYPTKELAHCVTDSSELELAAGILRQALTLKANAGGAIKEKIKQALQLINK